MSSSTTQRGLPTAGPDSSQVEDIMTQLQILWPRYIRSSDLDKVAPNPDANFIAEMQSLRAAIQDLEDRLLDIEYGSADARIDQMMQAMAEMSPDVQESRIKSMIDEREELRVEMDNQYDLDLDHPSMFPPPIEYYRTVTEIELLEDFIDFVDTEDMDTEDLPGDEESNRIAIETLCWRAFLSFPSTN